MTRPSAHRSETRTPSRLAVSDSNLESYNVASQPGLPPDDLARWEPMLRRLFGRLRGYPRSVTVQRADLYQEARLYLVELLREYDPRLNRNLEAYLYCKLRWRVANFLRAERRRGVDAGPLDLAKIRHPAAGLDGSAWCSPLYSAEAGHPRLARALRRLSPRQRAVIGRLYWQEKTAREVALELGISPQAVGRLRQRAEAALRSELTAPEDEES